MLFAACLLSVSLIPLFYLFNLTKKAAEISEKEVLASLLAHHVMEEIVAFCNNNPDSLPPITNEEPTVRSPENPQNVSEYFREILGKSDGLSETDFPALYWALKQYKCQIDTYFLEDNIYKVIVYVTFEDSGQKRKIFLERLISRAPSDAQNSKFNGDIK